MNLQFDKAKAPLPSLRESRNTNSQLSMNCVINGISFIKFSV